jgi:hypothetical protein
MLDLGYDESGERDALLVSCQIGKVGRLRRFSRKWKQAQESAGVEYFHAKDYANFSSGPFKGLNGKKRFKLLGKLGRLIHDYMDIGITARISEKVYRSEMTAKEKSRWGSAYCYAVQATILAAHLHFDSNGEDHGANVLLENGHRNVGDVVDKLSDLKREDQYLRVYIRSCGAGMKKDHPVLQAADMLAYSEWETMRGSPGDMYAVLNADGTPYKTIHFDCNPELIRATKRGIAAWRKSRKQFWESGRKKRTKTEAAER